MGPGTGVPSRKDMGPVDKSIMGWRWEYPPASRPRVYRLETNPSGKTMRVGRISKHYFHNRALVTTFTSFSHKMYRLFSYVSPEKSNQSLTTFIQCLKQRCALSSCNAQTKIGTHLRTVQWMSEAYFHMNSGLSSRFRIRTFQATPVKLSAPGFPWTFPSIQPNYLATTILGEFVVEKMGRKKETWRRLWGFHMTS